MTDFNITKARNFPLNRDGARTDYQGSEGDLVGLSVVNGDVSLVPADADSGVAVPAVGVLMEDVQNPTDINVAGFDDANIEQNQLRRQVREETDYTLVGEQGTYVFNGIMVSNVDGDSGFTVGEPVYLGVGGGFTQSKPNGTAGNLLQTLGVAVGPQTVLVDVDFDYATA